MTIYWWQNSDNGLKHLQRCSACNPAKLFFTSKFSYLIFCNPTHKTETGIANRWGTTDSEPPGPIKNTERQSHHIYYTLLCRCTPLLRPLSATANFAIMLSLNRFPERNRQILTFLHRILLCWITYWAPLEMHTMNFGFADPNHYIIKAE
jgi:hypothetical protein